MNWNISLLENSLPLKYDSVSGLSRRKTEIHKLILNDYHLTFKILFLREALELVFSTGR